MELNSSKRLFTKFQEGSKFSRKSTAWSQTPDSSKKYENQRYPDGLSTNFVVSTRHENKIREGIQEVECELAQKNEIDRTDLESVNKGKNVH